MITLTIGTWAPLHRSPLQQLISHLVIFTEGLFNLQFFALQSDELAHPLAKASTVAPELSAFFIVFATTVLTARTGHLFCTAFAFIPALKRATLVAFQGITWKKETKTKIE